MAPPISLMAETLACNATCVFCMGSPHRSQNLRLGPFASLLQVQGVKTDVAPTHPEVQQIRSIPCSCNTYALGHCTGDLRDRRLGRMFGCWLRKIRRDQPLAIPWSRALRVSKDEHRRIIRERVSLDDDLPSLSTNKCHRSMTWRRHRVQGISFGAAFTSRTSSVHGGRQHTTMSEGARDFPIRVWYGCKWR